MDRVERSLRVLVACERSGVVRSAFRARGFDAWSCDLERADDGSPFHIQGDAIAAAYGHVTYPRGKTLLDLGYVTNHGSHPLQTQNMGQARDLLIAHPECTYPANSGAKHLYLGMKKENGPNPDRWAYLGAAAQFFMTLWNAPIQHKAFENPIMLGHVKRLFPDFPEPTQIIQPWQHGHGETKATVLYLENLPPLEPFNIVDGREQRIWKMAPGPNRKKDRSRTFDGIAAAMADQWGDHILKQSRKAA